MNYNDTSTQTPERILMKMSKFELNGSIPLLKSELAQINKEKKTNMKAFHDTNKQREYIRFLLDGQPECRRLEKFLSKIDDFMQTKETKEKLFGKNANKYSYSPCVKPPSEGGDGENSDEGTKKKKNNKDKDKEEPKYNACKMKLGFEGDEERVATTKLIKIAGKSREVVTVTTVPDIMKEIRFKTTLSFVFLVSRIWGGNVAGKMQYGVILKIMVIKYIPQSGGKMRGTELSFSSSEEDDNESDDDSKKKKIEKKLDSDSDDDDKPKSKEVNKKEKEKEKKSNSKKSNTNKKASEDESNTNKNDSDDDSDKEPPPKEKKSKKAKKTSKNTKADDSDDESEIPVKSKSSKTSK